MFFAVREPSGVRTAQRSDEALPTRGASFLFPTAGLSLVHSDFRRLVKEPDFVDRNLQSLHQLRIGGTDIAPADFACRAIASDESDHPEPARSEGTV